MSNLRRLLLSLLVLLVSSCQGPQASLQQGNVAFREERFAQAEAHYREALQDPQTRQVAAFNLGKALLAQERAGEAEAMFREALPLAAKHPEVRLHLAETLSLQGRYPEAEEQLKRTLKVYPDLIRAHLIAGQLNLAREDYAKAAESFKRFLKTQPNDAEALLGFATALEGLNRREDALTVYRAVLSATLDADALHQKAEAGLDRLDPAPVESRP